MPGVTQKPETKKKEERKGRRKIGERKLGEGMEGEARGGWEGEVRWATYGYSMHEDSLVFPSNKGS